MPSNTFLSGEETTSKQSSASLLLSEVSNNSNEGSHGLDLDRFGQSKIQKKKNLKNSKIQIVHEENFVEETTSSSSINNHDCNEGGNKSQLNSNESSNENPDDEPPPLFFDSSLAISKSSEDNSDGSTVAKKVKNEEQSESSLMEQMLQDAVKAKKEKEERKNQASRKESKKMSFGLKKGFLTSSSNSSKKSSSKRKKKVMNKSDGKNGNMNDKHIEHPSDTIYELDIDGNMIPSTKHEEIPTIRPKQQPKNNNNPTTTNNHNPLYMEEVQEAMKSQPNISSYLSSNQHEWNTPHLLEQISQNKILSKGMMNPKFTAALEVFKSNPQKAKEQFRNHPDVTEFLNEFCKVMGNHFTQLGKKQDGAKTEKNAAKNNSSNTTTTTTTTVTTDNDIVGPMAKKAIQKEKERQEQSGKTLNDNMSQEEKQRLDTIMADRELTSLLMDRKLQVVMDECTRIPGKMRMYMEHPEYGPKLKKLIHAGLLRIV